MTEDIWSWLCRQLAPRVQTDFLPLGTTLTWEICRQNAFVGRIETRPEWQVYDNMDNDTEMD